MNQSHKKLRHSIIALIEKQSHPVDKYHCLMSKKFDCVSCKEFVDSSKNQVLRLRNALFYLKNIFVYCLMSSVLFELLASKKDAITLLMKLLLHDWQLGKTSLICFLRGLCAKYMSNDNRSKTNGKAWMVNI